MLWQAPSIGMWGCSSVPLAVLEAEAVDFLLLLVNDDHSEYSNKMSAYIPTNLSRSDHGSCLCNSLPSCVTFYCRNHFQVFMIPCLSLLGACSFTPQHILGRKKDAVILWKIIEKYFLYEPLHEVFLRQKGCSRHIPAFIFFRIWEACSPLNHLPL